MSFPLHHQTAPNFRTFPSDVPAQPLVKVGDTCSTSKEQSVYTDSFGRLYISEELHPNLAPAPPVQTLTPCGSLAENGDIVMRDGTQGNLFHNYILRRNGGFWREVSGKLKTRLQETLKQRAISGSEIPVIREGLSRLGLDGRGVGIGIMANDISLKDSQLGSHTQKVANVATDSQIGVAPGATCQFIEFQELQYSPAAMRDEPAGWIEEWQKRPAMRLEYLSDSIANKLANRSQDLRVLTPAYSVSKVQLVQELLGILELPDRQTGKFTNPNLRQLVYGSVPPASWTERCQKAFDFIDAMYEQSPYLKKAQERYRQVTQEAAKQGVFIVIPAGNQHDYLPRSVQTKPGSEFNELARSPYVISVANIDTNQTPGNYTDDMIEPTSSWGDGQYNPTVSAPGSNVLTGNQGDADDVDSGTSFSAPYVAGVLALMLQKNPGLTFEQGKQILQASCVKPPRYREDIYGAGVLNPLAAVNRAGSALPADGRAL